MADFEGKMNLNEETSEIEVNGKFKLTENELNMVSGGQVDYEASAGYKININGHLLNIVDEDWGCPCKALGHNPDFKISFDYYKLCGYCNEYRELDNPINGWRGYCIWEG